jgi:hypothetical protein
MIKALLELALLDRHGSINLVLFEARWLVL